MQSVRRQRGTVMKANVFQGPRADFIIGVNKQGMTAVCELYEMWNPNVVFYERTDGARLCWKGPAVTKATGTTTDRVEHGARHWKQLEDYHFC